MKRVYYRKLIRDKIPEKISNRGSELETRRLSKVEFLKELLKKAGEESGELFLKSKGKKEIVEEIADVLDVIDEILKFKKITQKQVIDQQKKNFEKKGGFAKRLYLVWSSDDKYMTNEKLGKK